MFDMSPTSNNSAAVLSIIIPALNEAHSIGETLDAVSRLSVHAEVIVVDGGSDDGTEAIAATHGARVLTSEPGRGEQMRRGAAVAHGAVLWFLHADTIVPPNAEKFIATALRDPRVVAGNFEVRFDGDTWAGRFMTWLYPKLRLLGLCYGDSAIFMRRGAYVAAGGFQALPIFEDLDLLGRLKQTGTFVHLPATVVTSSRRFAGRRFAITFIRWIALQLLFWLGMNPRRLARFYTRAHENEAKAAAAGNNPDEIDIYDDGNSFSINHR